MRIASMTPTLALVSALLLTPACAWKGPMPAAAMGEAEQSPQVIVLDEECYRAVGLQGLTTKITPAGIMIVRVEIANRTDGDHNIELRVLFGDERGDLVGEDPPWQNLIIPRAAYTIFDSHSQAPAEMFRVELRSP